MQDTASVPHAVSAVPFWHWPLASQQPAQLLRVQCAAPLLDDPHDGITARKTPLTIPITSVRNTTAFSDDVFMKPPALCSSSTPLDGTFLRVRKQPHARLKDQIRPLCAQSTDTGDESLFSKNLRTNPTICNSRSRSRTRPHLKGAVPEFRSGAMRMTKLFLPVFLIAIALNGCDC